MAQDYRYVPLPASRNRPVGPVRDPRSEAERRAAVLAEQARFARQTPTERLIGDATRRHAQYPSAPTTLAQIGAAPAETKPFNRRVLDSVSALFDDPAKYEARGGVPARGSVAPLASLLGDAFATTGAALTKTFGLEDRWAPRDDHRDAPPLRFAPAEGWAHAKRVLTGEEDPATTGSVLADLGLSLTSPENWFGVGAGKAAVAAVPAAGKLIPKALRAAQKMLPARNWNLFRRGVETTDNATRPLSMLLPAEIEPLTRSAGGVQRFVDTYNKLPDVNYLAAAIRRGAPKRGWYKNSRKALTEIFGDDADMFTGVLAAMSPQTSVESNMTNALNAFVNWRAAGRPTTREAIEAILTRSVQGGTEKSVLDAWKDNTVRVLQGGQTISGPKIDQFWLALRERALENKLGSMDPNDAMVLDAWMGNLMGASQELWSGGLSKANAAARLAASDAGVTPSYLAGVARMREAAKKVGVEGAEAQEMAWSTAMALYEQASSLGISAREVLRRGLLTDEVVAGTPDFATLLRQPEFASILSGDANLSSRMASLGSVPRARMGAVSMSDADQRQLLRVADTLDELRAMRVTDTAVQTPQVPPGEITVVVPTEAVTDKQWSSLVPYGDTTPGQRGYLSPRVFGAAENLRQQPAVLDAALRGGTGSRSRGLGSWVDDTGQVQENPLASYGVRMREVQGGGLPVGDERRLRAARDITAGGTGQSAAAHVAINPRMPRAQHDAATIYAARDIKTDAMSAFAAELRALDVAGSFTPIHSGRSVRVLRLDDQFKPMPLSPSEETSVRELAERYLVTENAKGQRFAPRMETGQNVASDGYREISQSAKAASGERVRRMVGDVSDWVQLPPATQRQMDTEIKTWASQLKSTLDMPRIRRERPDEARMLEILASSGGSGLATARGAGVVLPALAALGFGLAPARSSGAVPQREEL